MPGKDKERGIAAPGADPKAREIYEAMKKDPKARAYARRKGQSDVKGTLAAMAYAAARKSKEASSTSLHGRNLMNPTSKTSSPDFGLEKAAADIMAAGYWDTKARMQKKADPDIIVTPEHIQRIVQGKRGALVGGASGALLALLMGKPMLAPMFVGAMAGSVAGRTGALQYGSNPNVSVDLRGLKIKNAQACLPNGKTIKTALLKEGQ